MTPFLLSLNHSRRGAESPKKRFRGSTLAKYASELAPGTKKELLESPRRQCSRLLEIQNVHLLIYSNSGNVLIGV